MLQEQINLKWKELFKARDAVGKSAFECVKSKILVAEKSGNYELPLADSIVEGIIVKEVKEQMNQEEELEKAFKTIEF